MPVNTGRYKNPDRHPDMNCREVRAPRRPVSLNYPLLIAGASGAGKSTLLITALLESGALSQAEGYLTARVQNKSGQEAGFCLRSLREIARMFVIETSIMAKASPSERALNPESFELAFARQVLNLNAVEDPNQAENPHSPETPNPAEAETPTQRLYFNPRTPDVYRLRADSFDLADTLRGAIRAWEAQSPSRLLVIDELGGIELLDDRLAEMLARLVRRPRPALLVYKSRKTATRMLERQPLTPEEKLAIFARRQALDQAFTRNGCQLSADDGTQVQSNDLAACRRMLLNYLRANTPGGGGTPGAPL